MNEKPYIIIQSLSLPLPLTLSLPFGFMEEVSVKIAMGIIGYQTLIVFFFAIIFVFDFAFFIAIIFVFFFGK